MKLLSALTFALLMALPLVATSCVTGPQPKDKTFLESLNGKHYETDAPAAVVAGGAIPLGLSRRAANTTIDGDARIDALGGPLPFSNQMLAVVRDGKTLARTRSDASGHFQFAAQLPDGECEIKAESPKFKGAHRLEIKGYELRDVQVTLERM